MWRREVGLQEEIGIISQPDLVVALNLAAEEDTGGRKKEREKERKRERKRGREKEG